MKPNIILIVVDSLRNDHVTLEAGTLPRTPNLCQLAEEGIVFEQAISQGPSTRVSMSALMSSTYASLYGGQKRLPATRPVIQEMLKDAGYSTAGITSNLYLSRSFGWQRGFDHYDDCRPEAVYHRKFWLRALNQFAKLLGVPLGWPKSLPAELVFENAQTFLGSTKSPFFLWVHLMDVHWPYAIQKFSWSREWRQKRKSDEALRPRLVARPPQISAEEHDLLLSEYREAISYTDEQIGFFVRNLKERGLLDNSWLVVTADHGEEFREHGQYFHHPTLYDELVHVPLIVRPPDTSSVKKSHRIREQVRLIDLVPTFLALAQVTLPPATRLFGESLLPLLEGKSSDTDRPALIESPENQTLALRCDGWKYIWHPEADHRLLFNLHEDEGEYHDLSREEPERAEAMHAVLEEHLSMTRQTAHGASSGEEDAELDRELLVQLRSLGYME